MAGPVVLAASPAAEAAAPRQARRGLVLGLAWTAWGVSAAMAVGLLAQPLAPTAQLALCAAACGGMLALWLLCPPRGLPRMAFIALAMLVVGRYVYWRLAGTLPGLDDPVGFALGLVLLAAELYCVLILTVSLIVNADPLERPAAPLLPEAALPTVDVFVPSYNEPADILALTLAAARRLDYPAERLTVWLLDDGGTDGKCADPDPARAAAARARRESLQALCAELGVRYLARARNEHAKAGNLNAGLAAATGELVLVLDADHAPFRPFLRETVGLFAADPKLFLVQTPHVFLNPDPIERNLRTFGRMPSENEMFYGLTQRGLDKWNASFFCGSAALLRRSALDAVGGFSGITITEDCETAFELHARGWTSAYVDKPLIAGLQPETLADFIGQRARWCQGMFQILILKNPLNKPGLGAIQRLSYLSSMGFWFFPLPRLIFMLAPLLHIFFDVKIFVASIDEAIAFTATYVVANMMMQNYLYGRLRWPWVSELYEYVQGVYLIRSIASVLISPRKPHFNVTAKGGGLDADRLSPLAGPYFAIFGLLAAGCATAAWRYLYEPGVTSLMLVVGLWCLFNLVIAGAALGVVAERRRTEACPSLPTARPARLALGAETFAVTVERAASDACVLRRGDGAAWAARPVAAGTLTLEPVPGRPALAPLAVTGTAAPGGEYLTVSLGALTPGASFALADLIYGDPAPLRAFLAGRRRHENLLTGSLRLLRWGLGEPVRAFAYAAAALRTRGTAADAPAVSSRATPVEAFAAAPSAERATPQEAAAPPLPRADEAVAPPPSFDTQAWRTVIEALRLGETVPSGMIVTGFESAEWRACIRALAAAERRIEAREAGRLTPPAARPAASVHPAGGPQPAPEAPTERRDPASRGAAMRRVA